MRTKINGQTVQVSPVAMVQILAAAMRVQVCRELQRLKGRDQLVTDAHLRVAELEDELQALDEISAEARAAA